MMLRSRTACVAVCASSLLAGCGKDDKETARFNESIGGRGPITVSGIDAGLLQDPSAYKPAAAGASALGSGADSGGGTAASGGGGGEADAAEKAVTGVVESVVNFSAASILDYFDPSEVKTLADGGFSEALQGTFDALGIVSNTLKSKMSEAETAAMAELPAQLTKVAGDAIEITIVDPDNATATFDPSKVQAWAMEYAAKAAAANPAAAGSTPPPAETPARVEQPDGAPAVVPDSPAPGAPPTGADPLAALLAGGAGSPPPPVTFPLKKIDGKWRIVMGHTVSQELADVLKEGCELTRETLVQLNGRLDPVPANDQQAMQNAVMSMMPVVMGQFTGWFQRLQAALAESGAAASGGKKPDDEKKDEPPAENSRVINP